MHTVDTTLSKAERRESWLKKCQDNKLSVEQMNRSASIIPQDAKIKVLKWPKLQGT